MFLCGLMFLAGYELSAALYDRPYTRIYAFVNGITYTPTDRWSWEWQHLSGHCDGRKSHVSVYDKDREIEFDCER